MSFKTFVCDICKVGFAGLLSMPSFEVNVVKSPLSLCFLLICLLPCPPPQSAHQSYSHRVKSVTMSNWEQPEVDILMAKNGGGECVCSRPEVCLCQQEKLLKSSRSHLSFPGCGPFPVPRPVPLMYILISFQFFFIFKRQPPRVGYLAGRAPPFKHRQARQRHRPQRKVKVDVVIVIVVVAIVKCPPICLFRVNPTNLSSQLVANHDCDRVA